MAPNSSDNNNDPVRSGPCSENYQRVIEAATYIRQRANLGLEANDLELGIICGSGLGLLGDQLTETVQISYDDIPHFERKGHVIGHAGQLVIGTLEGKRVVAMKGRFHPYEGYEPWQVAFPVRVMKLLGVEGIIVTNAAGGLNPNFKVGDFMIIEDHLYLPGMAGFNPLVGPNEGKFGTRFPAMGDAYDAEWRAKFEKIGSDLGYQLRRGVYTCVFGPNFESPAEVKFLRLIGGDAVGMSTVHEVVAARHAGLRVLAISMITNVAQTESNSQDLANHTEVIQSAETYGERIVKMVTHFVKTL